MKQAHKVEDALEVQRQIAEVRSEIEKLEGRKRFLENRASLSTITVSLQTPRAIAVNTSGFGRDVREAVADSVQVAIAIVLFLIRFVIVMIPVFLLIILPGYLIARYFLRRARKARRTVKPNSDPQIDQTEADKPAEL
jgi:Flp pilus assembly protein TadB